MNKLKEYRSSNGLTQTEVAQKLEVTQSQYHRLESGKSLLNAKQILDLCELYNCSPNDILGFQGVHTVVMDHIEK